MFFVPITYTLATEEAERIGVDHVARMASSNDAGENSYVAEHLIAQSIAIKMLYSRVKLVLQYIKAVDEGTLKPNHEILREAYTLSHRLPVIQNPTFRQEYYTVCIPRISESPTSLKSFYFSSNQTMLPSSLTWARSLKAATT